MMARVNERYDSSSVLEHDQNVRVEDFLNDKLQTKEDLDTLDSLLSNVKNQQLLLKQQVGSHTALYIRISGWSLSM
jgi:hypothetical protein